MKELKLSEPKEIMITSLGVKVNIKPYLTISEINEIVNICSNENPITRDLLMYGLIIDKCTDIVDLVTKEENKVGINLDLYELYKVNGVIEELLEHIDENYICEIESYIAEFNSLNAKVEDIKGMLIKFLESATNTLDSVAKGDMDKKLNGVIDMAKNFLNKKENK